MPRLYILCGMPACGKSTWAAAHASPNIVWISRDKIRFSLLKDGEDYFAHEREVFKKFSDSIARALIDGNDVIADATHLDHYSRNKLLRAINRHAINYEIHYVVFTTSVTTCLKRNSLRNGLFRVPDEAMLRFANHFEDITLEEKANNPNFKIEYVNGDSNE